MEKDELIDNAIQAASLAVKDAKEAKSQINNLINFIQSDKTDYGLRKLMLFISRQMNRSTKKVTIISRDFGSKMLDDFNQLLGTKEGPSEAVEYLTFVKWAFEALDKKNKPRGKIASLDDFLKEVKS